MLLCIDIERETSAVSFEHLLVGWIVLFICFASLHGFFSCVPNSRTLDIWCVCVCVLFWIKYFEICQCCHTNFHFNGSLSRSQTFKEERMRCSAEMKRERKRDICPINIMTIRLAMYSIIAAAVFIDSCNVLSQCSCVCVSILNALRFACFK